MGRPEPCVLYAHTFVHPHLDEYVDEIKLVRKLAEAYTRWKSVYHWFNIRLEYEKGQKGRSGMAFIFALAVQLLLNLLHPCCLRTISFKPLRQILIVRYCVIVHLRSQLWMVLFSEPVVITACEFLEQNASSICPEVKLMGATSPPSFALEVFIQCEGETRFRRLCLPCLYSHSSSNVLEVEAVVTNHLVVRGSYRSLSMVIYGNTAEDLGQFSIEVDLDGSFTDTVSAVEGNLEDLPPAFHPTMLTIKEPVPPLKILSQAVVELDIPLELRKFLLLVFKSLDSQNLGEAADKPKQLGSDRPVSGGDADHTVTEAGEELLDLYRRLQNQSGDPSAESSTESLFLESEAGAPTSKELMETLHQHFDFCSSAGNVGYLHLSQNKNTILWLSVASLLCSARESCFHFVNYGGMKQLGYVFTHRVQNSTTLTLLLLGVIERATLHSIGCEGFLGWWPREDETVPDSTSDGYNQLLKLLLENQRHDVASLQLIFFIACCTVLSVLGGISAVSQVTNFTLDMLASAKVQLKKLLIFILGDAGLLAYKTTSGLINLSNCGFSNWDIDSHLLSLLKFKCECNGKAVSNVSDFPVAYAKRHGAYERGFLPLSAALLSSSVLRSQTGHAIDLFVDIVSHIEAIILSFLFFVAQKEDLLSLRYAYVLMSKGFFIRPKEVGMIVEMHMRALIVVDSLCKLIPHTEEFLWALWDLCRLSRSECGRQALLVLVNFPEALKVLMTALHSGRELDPVPFTTGVSPLNLAIFHSAAEIFEVIVTDSTASSLKSWIDHAKELHMALHSSSPGSNKKDAPARLLEWIDAGVVYHRNGAIGLLRYAAVLASGGDVHMASDSVLASDMMDVDNVVGDSSSTSDGCRCALYDEGAVMVIHAVMINCKQMLERSSNIYDYLVDEGGEGSSTPDLLLEQSLSEKSVDLFTLVILNEVCLLPKIGWLVARTIVFGHVFEKLDLFPVDLVVESLEEFEDLKLGFLTRIQEAKEQHKNTKLMNVLLQLHREVSPKLAACAAELSHSCPDFVLGFGAVCHLLASALACWPVYSWTPGLFHFLLDSLHATPLLALGPKETCSLLCLLYLAVEEWNANAEPSQRAMAVGTLLGPQKEKQINWYLRPGNPEKLVAQLSPQLVKLGEIILHCAVSTLSRVLVIRIACLNLDYASLLVKPIISWISHRLSEPSMLTDVDAYKVHQLLKFLANLLEHPYAKALLLKEGAFEMLTKVLEKCIGAANSDVKQFHENAKFEFSLLSWSIPVFQSISLISDGQASVQHSGVHDRNIPDSFTDEEYLIFWSYLLRFCMVLPLGTELLACLSAFKGMGSSTEGQSALLSIVKRIQSSTVQDSESQIRHETNASCGIIHASEWKEHPPLLCCWTTLLRSIDTKDVPAVHVAAAIDTLASGALGFCMDGKRKDIGWYYKETLSKSRCDGNDESVEVEGEGHLFSVFAPDGQNGKTTFRKVASSFSLELREGCCNKVPFGVKNDNSLESFVEENLKHIEELTNVLESETGNEVASDTLHTPHQIKETSKLLLLLLQKSSGTQEVDAEIATAYTSLLTPPVSSRIHKSTDRSMERIEDYSLDEATFFWECPENLRNRMTQTGLSAKRKISSLDGPNRHARGDNSRKPNTSRPPSMHVDDYVARERNADGTNSSNVIAVPRIGSSSGRPPSIHVDVFMARQRERQNVVGIAVNDTATQVKTTVPDDSTDAEKSSKPQQLKPDLDDDLQGIDIVFDAEESEPDDKLPFPQPDDNLQQPPSVVIEPRSPHSIVEETESDVNENSQFSHLGTPLASNMDENTPSEYSSRMSASRPERPLTREPSISSDKKFSEQSEDSKGLPIRTSMPIDSSASVYMNTSSSSVRYPVDSRTPPNLYPKAILQQSGPVPLGTGFQGFYDQKFPSNQPPLPPMPPPPTVSPVMSQNMDPVMTQTSSFVKSVADVQAQGPQVQSEYTSAVTSSSTSLATSIALPDMKFGRTSLSSPMGSARPPPPLPPTPPPYSANSSLKNSTSQSAQYFQTVSNSELHQTSVAPSVLTSYPPPPLMQPMLFRPGSMPVNLYGNSFVPHPGDNMHNVSQNLPISLPAVQPMPILTQLQPLQPPQIPRPPPQHLRPPVPSSPQPQVSPAHAYYQTQQQQENVSHSLQQQHVDRSQRIMQMSGDATTSQQQDSGMSLQEFFKSPEAIQSLLSDREKLCQLLEQHPKLMQMLQIIRAYVDMDMDISTEESYLSVSDWVTYNGIPAHCLMVL
ncbi:hypothetical protein DH2020_018177 [Rehmannia glutinosa]|uniref:Virilizer N-terminal domain-containing protein n=1 Tax=Rehmannia glutinosa TaxID=99300 RepID=A0ABR0WMD3_REHGL